jgi:ABC-type Mn2+/Zn2+ transport system ATPase subunit
MAAMGEASALWASGLGVRFGRRWVFRDLAVGLKAGEIVRLSGAKGGGKSTLLRVLAGVLRPQAGLVRHRPSVIGYVPERFPPPPLVTTEQYLRRMGRLRGLSDREAFHRADAVIDRYGLRPLVDGLVSELAPEDQRRVCFAQAVLDRPSLLVLDDPWADLKGTTLVTATSEIRQLAEAGCVVLFTDRAWRVRALEIDEHKSLSGGILFDLPHEEPASGLSDMRIDLYGHGERFDQLTGLIEYRPHPDGLTVLVDHEHTNDVLRAALQGGWLVRRVEPNQ